VQLDCAGRGLGRSAHRWRVVAGPGLAWNDNARPGTEPGGTPSIAVMAFAGTADDPDADALARDVAADLVSELARSPGLRVVASQSSFQFAGGQTPLAEIGQRLRSRYIAAGTVRREGEQLRIAVELLDSQDGKVIWSSSNVVDRTTLAATQSALVSRIAGTMQAKVSGTEQRLALAQPPKSLDVYVLVARGRAMHQRFTAQGMRDARRLFEQALAIDPDDAPAWAYLGITNTVDIGLRLTGEWDNRRLDEVLAQIRRHAGRCAVNMPAQPERRRLLFHPWPCPVQDGRGRGRSSQLRAGAGPKPDAARLPAGVLRYRAMGQPAPG